MLHNLSAFEENIMRF